jgi:hypothetical protein
MKAVFWMVWIVLVVCALGIMFSGTKLPVSTDMLTFLLPLSSIAGGVHGIFNQPQADAVCLIVELEEEEEEELGQIRKEKGIGANTVFDLLLESHNDNNVELLIDCK